MFIITSKMVIKKTLKLTSIKNASKNFGNFQNNMRKISNIVKLYVLIKSS